MGKRNSTTLAETDELLLLHEWETAYLTDKRSDVVLLQDEFLGDPTCGLIDKDNKWAAVAGDHLTVWKSGQRHMVEGLVDIHSIRLKSTVNIEVLIDPWSANSAVWKLNVETLQKFKVRDILEYKEKPYTEEINW